MTMMVDQMQSGRSSLGAVLRRGREQIGSHDRAVKPMDLTTASDAAHHANIGTVDFGHDIADEELRQAECVWQSVRSVRHDSHSHDSHALFGAPLAREEHATTYVGLSPEILPAGISTDNPLELNKLSRAFGSEEGTRT